MEKEITRTPGDSVMQITKRRWTLEERENDYLPEATPWCWVVSPRLFGDVGVNINDFEPENYIYFLDNVRTLEDLIEGLVELSPLADDALDVAEMMTAIDFVEFKLTLAHERGQKEMGNFDQSRIPKRYLSILLPKNFINGLHLAKEFQVPLGAAVISMLELGAK